MDQSWVETKTARCRLGDGRLNRRLGTMRESGFSLGYRYEAVWDLRDGRAFVDRLLIGAEPLRPSRKRHDVVSSHEGGGTFLFERLQGRRTGIFV